MKAKNKIKGCLLLLLGTTLLYFTWGVWVGVMGALLGAIVLGLASHGSWLRNTSLTGNHQKLQDDIGGLDGQRNSGIDVTLNDLRVTRIPPGRGSITPDGRILPDENGMGGADVYQKPREQKGYPKGNIYGEQGGTPQDLLGVVTTLRDTHQLKSFISSRMPEAIDEAHIAQLVTWVAATLENHGMIPLPPKVNQQVNELAEQYRQQYPEWNRHVTTGVAGLVQDRGITESGTLRHEISNTMLAVNELPRNPHSKLLFDAYAKEALDNSGQVWTADSNKMIAENMLKNGVRPQRVEEALKHSPELVKNAHYFVKDISNNPDLQVVAQERGIARSLK